MTDFKSIVLLIDGDNTRMAKLGGIIQEISTYGRIVVKRAYANWKKDNLKNWETPLKKLAIKAEQQFDYVPGKNATDMALVIDAVDLLHKNIYDAFVIVSSDSDYTPLAIYLHESGVYVIGVGEVNTPDSFKNSCDDFITLDNIEDDLRRGEGASQSEERDFDSAKPEGDEPVGIESVHRLLRAASVKYQDDDGYVNVSAAGQFIKRVKPDFDVRLLGYEKLPKLIEAFPDRYAMKRYPGKGSVTIVAYKCIN